MESPALERMDRECLRSIFLGSHHALAFVLLAVKMKICRCVSEGNAVRTVPAIHNLPCLSQGLRQGVPPTAWKGHRRSHVSQSVNCNLLWWMKNQKEVIITHCRLVLLSPVKQQQLITACEVPESLLCWDAQQSPWTEVR